MSKVAFIRPHQSFEVEISPPLGSMALAAYARRETNAEVRIFDLQIRTAGDDDLAREVAAFDPDLIGFSALTCQAPEVKRLASFMRRRLPETPQIVGGPYGTAQAEQIIDEIPEADFAAIGEGERTLMELLAWRAGALDAEQIGGVARRVDGAAVVNPPRDAIADLDDLPFLAYDLVDVPAYSDVPRFSMVRKNKNYFAMFTSRGCPYKCNYCHLVFGKTFRFQSAERVLAELEFLYNRYGVREIQFLDDIFNLRRDRAIAIFRGIVERGWDLSITFPNGIRIDILDEEVADWMQKAGVVKSSVAIESASRRIQKDIKKNLRLDKAREGIRLLAERRIFTHGFFMMGFPGETREELLETARFARESRLHSAAFYFVLPLPGTPLYEQFESVVGRKQARARIQTHNNDPDMSSLSLAAAPAPEIRRIVRAAYFRFYANPSRAWRIVRDLPSKAQFVSLSFFAVVRGWWPHAERDIHRWRHALKIRWKSLRAFPMSAGGLRETP
ncbi:MAG: B12-binding domain-containing radical SAM protein [Deltaproteobacteria bacterium]|nr:B12-binding domain-containing radical SAM protein [Deltaproteobacteria bacterium]